MRTCPVRFGPCFAATMLGIACLAACAKPPQKSEESPLRRYEMRGVIVRLDTEHHVATIQHEKIEGWMDAMTMEYPVKDTAEFQNLHKGDRITATVFVRGTDYWIGRIHHSY